MCRFVCVNCGRRKNSRCYIGIGGRDKYFLEKEGGGGREKEKAIILLGVLFSDGWLDGLEKVLRKKRET